MVDHVTASQQLFGSATPARATDLLANPLSAALKKNPDLNRLRKANKKKRQVLDNASAGVVLGAGSII